MNQTFKKHDQVTRATKEEKQSRVKTATCLKQKQSHWLNGQAWGFFGTVYKYKYEAVGDTVVQGLTTLFHANCPLFKSPGQTLGSCWCFSRRSNNE